MSGRLLVRDLPAVNQFLLQYFINYNLKKGWYLTWQPTITANWEAASGNKWTVPYGGGVGRIMKLGFQPVLLDCTVLWQRHLSGRSSVLEHAATDCVSVSKVKQAAGEDDDGAKTETIGTRATPEEVNLRRDDKPPLKSPLVQGGTRKTGSPLNNGGLQKDGWRRHVLFACLRVELLGGPR